MSQHDVAERAAGFGRRLREARRLAGMSQAELAGGELSPSYVSLLESGHRNATPEVVRMLADRLGCSVGYLLEGREEEAVERLRLGLSYVELALRNGEAADALTQVEALTAPGAELGAEDRWRARRLRARALEGVGRLEEALEDVEGLREQARTERRHEDYLRLTVDAVRCYQELGDVDYALDVGEAALPMIRDWGLVGTDAHAELASTVLGAYYERGDLVRAQRMATEVLDVVERAGSAKARAAVYWNASLVAEQRDDLPAALLQAERALAIYAEGDDSRALARLRVAYGWLLLRCLPPQPEAARAALVASRAELAEVGGEVDLAYCETELARCELLLGRPEEALRLARSGLSRLGSAPRLETAHTTLVHARALLTLGHRAEAVADYRAAAGMLAELRLSRHAAAAWRELADAFTELGRLEDAALAYQQALNDAGVRGAPDVARASSRMAPPGQGPQP